MPKVIIWRDDAVETEFDPAHRDWRIGRSETNDIALLDPRKSVSRFHAELREENGQWYFIDLNSQNGSWRDGQRVSRLALEHDMEVSFGDYRLVFVHSPREVPPLVPSDAQDTAATEVVAEVPPVNPDQTLLMPSARKTETPTPPAGTPLVRPKVPAATPKKGVNPVILVVFLLAMFGAVAAVGWRLVQSMSEEAPAPAQSVAPAPTPAPAPPVTPVPEPVPAVAETPPPAEAEAAVEPPPAPKAAPKAASGRSTSRAARKQAPAAPKVPPEVETQYAAGRRALTAQRFSEAVRAFEAVLALAPGFRDTEALLADARGQEKAARTQALADGKRLEAAGEWAPAVAAYERAGASSEAAAARTRMHAAGDDAYRKARQFDARNRAAEAIGWYERAVDWLSPQDPRRQTARNRLTELKGGVE
jgi:pSer/pThr/pTyr-binding forkhead associated (FHA) protein